MALLAALLFVVILFVWHCAAQAETIEQYIHRVYPSCCPHEGCQEVPAQRVGNAWLIEWQGRQVLYTGRTFVSPNTAAIACGNRDNVWCLLVPGGVS